LKNDIESNESPQILIVFNYLSKSSGKKFYVRIILKVSKVGFQD